MFFTYSLRILVDCSCNKSLFLINILLRLINCVWFICCCCSSCCWIELIGFSLPVCGWYFNGFAILAFISNDLRLANELVVVIVDNDDDVFKLLFVIVDNFNLDTCSCFIFGVFIDADDGGYW